ncbi:MAG: c-type cytochrome [Nitrospirota bacterium]
MRRIEKKKNAFIMLCTILAFVILTLQTSPVLARSTGEKLYLQHCAACHQPDGRGIPGFFPALAGNPLVTSEEPAKVQEYLERIIFGYHGALTVRGELYAGTMPPIGYFGRLSDSELLDLINYQRTAWGNKAKQIALSDLKMARDRWGFLAEIEDLCIVQYDRESVSYLPDGRVSALMRTSHNPKCKEYKEIINLLKKLGKRYEDFQYNMDLYEINCRKNTFKLLETSHLTRDGKTIHSFKHKGDELEIPAGSVLNILKDIVCKKERR